MIGSSLKPKTGWFEKEHDDETSTVADKPKHEAALGGRTAMSKFQLMPPTLFPTV